ncbi:ABC transporter ATP-binding protein [Treponema zuelzerae]|uniref:ABC transporter ATP-binding protein n=1 Tax=Teretinema zuelzerae TaxID=156 RepID=A0AAE3EH13_9SPIR|nr:ABC transporter ATP-binding protein [Teretinema zuelzerae]MBN2810725.1 ABC transporter ATP-binding protein [Spirochaetales bacterium]MCD1653688.1 ABC transporter ATP-binding protein [Teretinema zuelzerae]HPO01856.1 ABC transporter ATP-binding protein [Treponemataceae bacterium]
MIDVSSVSKNYIVGAQEVRALKKVSLKVETGEFLALAGPSGSGKTTLLNLIGCIDSVTEGIISLDGETISGLDQNKRNLVRQRKIGFIFQSYNLIPVLTARENVALALQLVKGIGEKEIAERTSKILAEVGLSGMEDRKPSQLSGGQQQRVSIARALVKEPPVILADEPTANLDSKTGREILALMRELNEQHDTTFIFSTHDPMVMEQARVLVKLHDGEITGIEKR